MTTQQSANAKMRRNRLSLRSLVIVMTVVAILVAAAVYVSVHIPSRAPDSVTPNNTPPNGTANYTTITFNFDTGSPSLIEGQNTPLNQTSSGLLASFSSPSDSANPAFSIQSYETTFFTLSEFSGKWLYDNRITRDALIIRFSQQLISINFTFATLEYHGGPTTEPTEIKLTAHMDSTETAPIGSATARGTFSSSSYPQGTLSFASANKPFNLVRIEIPYVPNGATDFFVDNITVAPVQ